MQLPLHDKAHNADARAKAHHTARRACMTCGRKEKPTCTAVTQVEVGKHQPKVMTARAKIVVTAVQERRTAALRMIRVSPTASTPTCSRMAYHLQTVPHQVERQNPQPEEAWQVAGQEAEGTAWALAGLSHAGSCEYQSPCFAVPRCLPSRCSHCTRGPPLR